MPNSTSKTSQAWLRVTLAVVQIGSRLVRFAWGTNFSTREAAGWLMAKEGAAMTAAVPPSRSRRRIGSTLLHVPEHRDGGREQGADVAPVGGAAERLAERQSRHLLEGQGLLPPRRFLLRREVRRIEPGAALGL